MIFPPASLSSDGLFNCLRERGGCYTCLQNLSIRYIAWMDLWSAYQVLQRDVEKWVQPWLGNESFEYDDAISEQGMEGFAGSLKRIASLEREYIMIVDHCRIRDGSKCLFAQQADDEAAPLEIVEFASTDAAIKRGPITTAKLKVTISPEIEFEAEGNRDAVSDNYRKFLSLLDADRKRKQAENAATEALEFANDRASAAYDRAEATEKGMQKRIATEVKKQVASIQEMLLPTLAAPEEPAKTAAQEEESEPTGEEISEAVEEDYQCLTDLVLDAFKPEESLRAKEVFSRIKSEAAEYQTTGHVSSALASLTNQEKLVRVEAGLYTLSDQKRKPASTSCDLPKKFDDFSRADRFLGKLKELGHRVAARVTKDGLWEVFEIEESSS